jgi:hypothetical protein
MKERVVRKRIVLVLAAVVVSSVFLTSAPAGALTGTSVSLCVNSETSQFEYDITVSDVEGDTLIIELLNGTAIFQWISVSIAVNQADGGLVLTGPLLNVTSGVPTNSWALPFSSTAVSSVAATSRGWDVTWSGSVANGTSPYSPGDTLYLAFARDTGFGDSRILSVPINDCNDEPPPTTVPPTTVPPTVAPTSVVSTTIPEVETDVADGDGTSPAVPVLIGVGFLTLVAVAVRARRIER